MQRHQDLPHQPSQPLQPLPCNLPLACPWWALLAGCLGNLDVLDDAVRVEYVDNLGRLSRWRVVAILDEALASHGHKDVFLRE